MRVSLTPASLLHLAGKHRDFDLGCIRGQLVEIHRKQLLEWLKEEEHTATIVDILLRGMPDVHSLSTLKLLELVGEYGLDEDHKFGFELTALPADDERIESDTIDLVLAPFIP